MQILGLYDHSLNFSGIVIVSCSVYLIIFHVYPILLISNDNIQLIVQDDICTPNPIIQNTKDSFKQYCQYFRMKYVKLPQFLHSFCYKMTSIWNPF